MLINYSGWCQNAERGSSIKYGFSGKLWLTIHSTIVGTHFQLIQSNSWIISLPINHSRRVKWVLPGTTELAFRNGKIDSWHFKPQNEPSLSPKAGSIWRERQLRTFRNPFPLGIIFTESWGSSFICGLPQIVKGGVDARSCWLLLKRIPTSIMATTEVIPDCALWLHIFQYLLCWGVAVCSDRHGEDIFFWWSLAVEIGSHRSRLMKCN